MLNMEEFSRAEFWKYASQKIQNLLDFSLRVNNEDLLYSVNDPGSHHLYTPQPSTKINLKTSKFCRNYKIYSPLSDKLFERLSLYEPIKMKIQPKTNQSSTTSSARAIKKKIDFRKSVESPIRGLRESLNEDGPDLKIAGNKANISLPPLKTKLTKRLKEDPQKREKIRESTETIVESPLYYINKSFTAGYRHNINSSIKRDKTPFSKRNTCKKQNLRLEI
ncbi:unnamed protein product [Blepharisma stoltei]|uniref:Uncharacterized protein n=1 Tax=Blepharisma stoltei TaxID=1481888 RepID=A0AAU9J7F2_9CILI|nr:unnamed protein product [Blepharisma stoltei]